MTTVETERPQIFYKRPIDFLPFAPSEIADNVCRLSQYVRDVAVPRGDLRRGQVEALEETVRFLENGGRVAYVEQASGYGKSRWMEEVGIGYGGRQVYITPGETASNNIEGKLYGKKDLGRVDQNHKEFGHDVTIITMQMLETLSRGASRGDKSRNREMVSILTADLVFADEVHHYLTPERRLILAGFLFFNPKSVMFGASATEGYNSIKNAEQQFGKCLHRVGLAEAVEEEVLISPHVVFVRTGASLDNSMVNSKGNIIFDSSVPVSMRDKMLLEAYLRDCDREGKLLRSISYLSTKEHAYDFTELAERMGVPSDVVVDGVRNRNGIYDRLKEGRLATVATVETAIESLDLPWLEGIMVSAQTKSLRVAYQMFPRPMRNSQGKSEPYIWQALDNGTLYENRPILVTDILGVRRFVNGSVVTPRKIEGGRWADFDLGSNRVYQEDTELPPGVEVNVEVIDIYSLFRMGILDRAKLLGQGLLPPAEAEKFRQEINNHLGRIYKREPITNVGDSAVMSGVKLYDETLGEYVSMAVIIVRACGLENSRNIKAAYGNAFGEFLKTGKFVLFESVKDTGIKKTAFFVDPEFVALCQKFREQEITDDEKKSLAKIIREMLESQREKLPAAAAFLKDFRIEHSQFMGTIGTLSRFMGLDKTSKRRRSWFASNSRDKLFKFVNTYSDGEPFGSDKNQLKRFGRWRRLTNNGTMIG